MSVSSTGFSPTSVFPSQKTPSTTLSAKPAQTTEQKFLEYAKMTPAERLHAQMLAELGLTEDQFKAMKSRRSAEDRGQDQGYDQEAARQQLQQADRDDHRQVGLSAACLIAGYCVGGN